MHNNARWVFVAKGRSIAHLDHGESLGFFGPDGGSEQVGDPVLCVHLSRIPVHARDGRLVVRPRAPDELVLSDVPGNIVDTPARGDGIVRIP